MPRQRNSANSAIEAPPAIVQSTAAFAKYGDDGLSVTG
jgi:hypothetical protein